MEIVPAASAAEAFQLPDGWVLELRPRGNCSSSSSKIADKYYYEPHTGRQFRSLVSIKRYLDGEDEPTPRRKAPKTHQEDTLSFGTSRRIVYNGKLWKLEEFEEAVRQRRHVAHATVQHRASSLLPDGWIVEEVPRRCGLRRDSFFIEPVTRRKFRSVPEVQRYLTADDEFGAKYKPLKMIDSREAQAPRKLETPSLLPELVKPEDFDIFNPPEKITWMLSSSSSSSGHEMWIPFFESSRIPDYVKELWEETFLLCISGRRKQHRIPFLTANLAPIFDTFSASSCFSS